MSAPTPATVAEWMAAELEREEFLYQETAVYEIAARFGEEFTYENERGAPAISRKVLREFGKLTGDSVIWERREKMWRKRAADDMPGRQQD
jgi:hypothetical protein